MFDTHSHLTMCEHLNVADHLKLFREAGGQKILDPGLWVDDLESRFQQLKEFQEVDLGIAFAPHYINRSNLLDLPDLERRAEIDTLFNQLENYLKRKEEFRIVAFSEIGMDFYYTDDSKNHQLQEEIFLRQLELAKKYKLPAFLHIRDAYDRTFALIKQANFKNGAVHCFTGNQKDADNFLDWGFYLSFSGIVTFKNARELHEIARNAPIEKILTETDSPYLSPIPLRGQKNNSSHLYHTNHFLAELKNLTVEETHQILSDNAKRLLGILPKK